VVFGKRAGEFAARFAKEHTALEPDQGEVNQTAREALAPFDRPAGENPYQVQHALQVMMQDLVGIVRREEEMARAVDGLETLRQRANRAGVTGNREYNPGWHTALDLPNLLTVSEAVARSAIERKESRGGHFRDDYPEKDAAWGSFNLLVQRRPDGGMAVRREPVVGVTDELTRLVEKYK
jgi:succinate dehydrogenase / fumarate reductase flavoprotein subunit